MPVAIFAVEKLRVVIVLDHAIRKEGLARITATAARSSSIKSATLQSFHKTKTKTNKKKSFVGFPGAGARF